MTDITELVAGIEELIVNADQALQIMAYVGFVMAWSLGFQAGQTR